MLTYSKIPISWREDLNDEEKILWRTLVKATFIDYSNNRISLKIPEWNRQETLHFDMDKLPENMLKRIQASSNEFYALVNINSSKCEDIYIEPLER
jgi:hypothetical protein